MPYLQVSVDPGGVLMSLPECLTHCETCGSELVEGSCSICSPEGWR